MPQQSVPKGELRPNDDKIEEPHCSEGFERGFSLSLFAEAEPFWVCTSIQNPQCKAWTLQLTAGHWGLTDDAINL